MCNWISSLVMLSRQLISIVLFSVICRLLFISTNFHRKEKALLFKQNHLKLSNLIHLTKTSLKHSNGLFSYSENYNSILHSHCLGSLAWRKKCTWVETLSVVKFMPILIKICQNWNLLIGCFRENSKIWPKNCPILIKI